MAKSILKVKGVAADALSPFMIEGTGLPSLACLRGFSDSAPKVKLPVEKGIDAEPQQRKTGENNVKERASWMPHPVTGNFMPEDHFGEVDIVELRENVLSNHSRSKRPT